MRRARSSYSKTRKFHGNQHTQRQKFPESCSDVGHDEQQKGKRLAASSRKLNPSKRQKVNDDSTSMEKLCSRLIDKFCSRAAKFGYAAKYMYRYYMISSRKEILRNCGIISLTIKTILSTSFFLQKS